VLPTAAPHERAGVLSVIYLVSYTAMGLPAIIAGVLVVEGGGLLTSTIEYGVAEIAIAGLALIGLLRRAPMTVECAATA
jgi:hypothetical protein